MTDRDAPGGVHNTAGLAEEALRQSLVACFQARAQGKRLHRGHGHSLTIDWGEAADRVTEDKEAIGEARQLLVMAALVGRESV